MKSQEAFIWYPLPVDAISILDLKMDWNFDRCWAYRERFELFDLPDEADDIETRLAFLGDFSLEVGRPRPAVDGGKSEVICFLSAAVLTGWELGGGAEGATALSGDPGGLFVLQKRSKLRKSHFNGS